MVTKNPAQAAEPEATQPTPVENPQMSTPETQPQAAPATTETPTVSQPEPNSGVQLTPDVQELTGGAQAKKRRTQAKPRTQVTYNNQSYKLVRAGDQNTRIREMSDPDESEGFLVPTEQVTFPPDHPKGKKTATPTAQATPETPPAAPPA